MASTTPSHSRQPPYQALPPGMFPSTSGDSTTFACVHASSRLHLLCIGCISARGQRHGISIACLQLLLISSSAVLYDIMYTALHLVKACRNVAILCSGVLPVMSCRETLDDYINGLG